MPLKIYYYQIVFSTLFISYFSFGATTYTVGATGNYSTISAAYAACTGATSYILEIQSNYNYNSETSTGANSITLSALANKSNTNSVTIRPATGVSLTLTGTASSLFTLDGANWVIFDGRAGGVGSTAWTIINNSAAASKRVFTLQNDASNNTIKYLTIQGDNASTTAGAAGLILFSNTIGSTGNDSNTIDNCIFQKNASNPGTFIESNGELGYSNSSNVISNSNFINFNFAAIWASANSSAFTISSNHFFQTASVSPSTGFKMILIDAGGGYTINGNYFGGRAVNCGGAAFTINTANEVYLIHFSSSSSGATNTVSANTFSNFNITTTENQQTRICILTANGTSNFVVGSASNANVIGATSGTGNFVITDNSVVDGGVGVKNTFIAFNMVNTATSSTVSYNSIGSLTIGGTNNSGAVIFVRTYGLATNLIVDHNTFGNSTANNISTNSNLNQEWITDDGGLGSNSMTVTYNTFQNIKSSPTLYLAGIYNIISSCTLTATNNTFNNINSTSQGFHYMIAHGDYYTSTLTTAATITSNTFQNLTLGNSSNSNSIQNLYVIYIQTSGASTCNNNTIGSTSSNNITYLSDNFSYGIYKDGTGTLTASGNTIQQFNLTGTNNGNYFIGIENYNGVGTLSNNVIRNITSLSTSTFPIRGIENSSSSNNQLISQNLIYSLKETSTSDFENYMIGISISTTSGSATISKNKIRSITNTSNPISNIGQIIGIYSFLSSSSINYYNNVIILSNSVNTNKIELIGISHGTTGSSKIYHNTISISGTVTISTFSTCLYDFATTNSRDVKNNIFQNKRTGAGSHYSIYITNNGVQPTYDYNYEEVSNNSNELAYAGGSNRTFSTWKTFISSSNDKNGTISIDQTTGLVPAGTNSDVKNTGTNLIATVVDDIDGTTRAAAPWMGAYESISALPISLINFSAELINNRYVELNWKTASESNNNYFTVEKTIDGNSFETVGIIKGAVNSTITHLYSLIDTNPYESVSYYRLKQTDLNGNFTYTNLVSVNKTNTLNLYPNPNNGLGFSLSSDKEILGFDIYNQVGVKVYSIVDLNASKNQFIQLNEFLESGTYIIKVNYLTDSEQSKFIVQ